MPATSVLNKISLLVIVTILKGKVTVTTGEGCTGDELHYEKTGNRWSRTGIGSRGADCVHLFASSIFIESAGPFHSERPCNCSLPPSECPGDLLSVRGSALQVRSEVP